MEEILDRVNDQMVHRTVAMRLLDIQALVGEIHRLRAEVAELQGQVEKWKSDYIELKKK